MSRPAKARFNAAEIKTAEHQASMRAVIAGAEHLFRKSREVTPVETTALVESGKVTPDPGNLRAAVSYDGPYAIWQHEDLDLHHDPGKTAKYLENPLASERDEILRIIGEEIAKELT